MSKTKAKQTAATAGLALLSVVFAIAMMASMAMAQAETGQIIGKVTDPNGAVVPGATVSIKSVNTGREVTTTADEAGVYSITSLQPGLYDLTVTGGSFKPSAQRVQVSVGSRMSVDTVLGYWLPITFTAGVAWRRDPVANHDGVTVFSRIGRAF